MPEPEAPCNRRDCSLPARWGCSVLLWDRNRRGRPVRMVIDVEVCEIHRRLLSAEQLLDGESWETVDKIFRSRGLEPPDRKLTEVECIPLGDPGGVLAGMKPGVYEVTEESIPLTRSQWERK